MSVAVATADNSYLSRVSLIAEKCTEHHGNFREQQPRQNGAARMRSRGMRIRVTCPKVQAKIVIMSQSLWYTKSGCAHIFTSHDTTHSSILIVVPRTKHTTNSVRPRSGNQLAASSSQFIFVKLKWKTQILFLVVHSFQADVSKIERNTFAAAVYSA